MGWITKKRLEGSWTGRYKKSRRATAPLRKIISFVSLGDSSLFGTGDKMKLECGHEVYTKAANKARCIYCKIEQEQINN